MRGQGQDAIVGLMLAFIGIGILVAWRTGALNALMGGSLYTARSVQSNATGLAGVADRLGNPRTSVTTRSPQGGSVVATGGTPDDAVSSTFAPAIRDPWGAGGYRDESTRAAARDRAPVTDITTAIRQNAQLLPYLAITQLPDSTTISYDAADFQPVRGPY